MPSNKTDVIERPDRVPALDALRALAVLAVASFHFGFNGPTANGVTFVAFPEASGIARYGYLGVQLFFVISGFVIAFSAEGRNASGFAIARMARIYPAFIFCMTVTFLVTRGFGAPEFHTNLAQWAANLLILAPALKQPYIDNVYWTILLELTFYAWVYLLMLARLFQRRIDVVVLVWLALSVLNVHVLESYAIRKVFLTDQSGFFATGLLLYELHKGRRDASLQWLLGLAATCAVFQGVKNVEWFRIHTGAEFDGWIVAALCAGIIVVTMLATRVRLALPQNLLAVGGLTYPLYLLHQQIGYVALFRLEPLEHTAVTMVVIAVFITIASWAVWRYVERPAQRMIKRSLPQIADWIASRRRPTGSKIQDPAS